MVTAVCLSANYAAICACYSRFVLQGVQPAMKCAAAMGGRVIFLLSWPRTARPGLDGERAGAGMRGWSLLRAFWCGARRTGPKAEPYRAVDLCKIDVRWQWQSQSQSLSQSLTT